MYPVSANFHTLAIQDAPKTRVRIYFIGDAVDCTNDNAVQTNGTLLVGKAGDTDSNGRIGQNGITFSEFFNPDKNIQVGAAVSSQIGMTLLNTDGALDNFQYGRCKVYLDVYDTANSSWLTCPMGVYIIDLPTKRKVQLVNATGYDQMQKLDAICDTWWSALNWSGGITLSQLLTSLATQIGVSVSSNTASAIVNGSVSFTEEPFQCVEVTYREVLEYIAEATGTVARFDRNGALDLRWFAAAQISGNTVTVNTDTVGNQCLAISVAEYSVAAVDLLKVKLYTDDIGTTVGTGTNQYTIVNNLFLDGANSAAIIAKATPIYNRLHGLGAYSPVSARIITDWSIEAGDIINIVNDSTTYSVPIFQQSMAWRGGYVVSDLLSDGDNVRPVLDYDERTYYRLNSEMSKKVGDDEIISKINQSPESITIQANKVNLTGYVTFTNLSTPGQTIIDGGNITTGTVDASVVNVSNINADNIKTGTLKAITIQDTGATPDNYWDLSGGNFVATNGSIGGFTLSSSGLSYGGIRPENSGTGFALQNDAIYYVSDYGSIRWITSLSGSGLSFGNNINATPGVWKWRTGLKHVWNPDTNIDSFVITRPTPPNRTTSSNIAIFADNGTNFYTKFIGDVEATGDLTVGGDVGATGDVTIGGNLTVGGVLDVTPRRCYAELSSAGWYRAIAFQGVSTTSFGFSSAVADICITRTQTNNNNEAHKISLYVCNGQVVKFINEESFSREFGIDGIRVCVGGNNAYIDIHYNLSTTNYVSVDFTVHTRYLNASSWTSENLQSVAASPNGETELLLHSFAANTEANGTLTAASGFTIAEDDARMAGRVVYVHFYATGSISANTGTNIGTLSGVPLPNKNIRWLAGGGVHAYDAVTPVYAILDTNGNINVRSPSAISAVNITISYIV